MRPISTLSRFEPMRVMLAGVLVISVMLMGGCTAGFLNPAFANTLTGAVVPLTPGPESDFILVRVINETGTSVEFVVTAEREELIDEGNAIITQTMKQTVRLLTFPFGQAQELGVLLDCSPAVTRIGLGENLDQPGTDAGIFINAEVGGVAGSGVPVNVAPLVSPGNFVCGDTVIFRAFASTGNVGGVKVQTALLDFQSQPSQFVGPDTFLNARRFLELQIPGDEG